MTLQGKFPGPYPYEGRVVDRLDPHGMGGIRYIIPGELDTPSKTWAYPVGLPASGETDYGALIAPPLNADVLLFFVAGDAENPRYLCGHYGVSEVPEGTAITADGDNIVWRDRRLQIEVDSRAASTGVRITDRATGAAVNVDIDATTQQIGISGALGVSIQSAGQIRIDGGLVLINGRPVLPGGEPI